MGGVCSTYEGDEDSYTIFIGNSQGTRLKLGRSRCRWEDNIKVGIREIEYDGVDWIQRSSGWLL
jgi:hypothetical protein